MITAVPSVALTVGANRVVKGIAIPTPIGKPDEEKEEELNNEVDKLEQEELNKEVEQEEIKPKSFFDKFKF